MPRLSDREIAGAVRDAGFPRSSWTVAVAVALAESGGNPDAYNGNNSDGSSDYGLFQINSVHAELLNTHNWRDPVDNARMALEISGRGTNWKPWVAYTTGRHVAFLPRARRATGSPVDATAGAVAGSGGTLFTGLPKTGINDPGTWRRIGFFILGGLLILIALFQLTGNPIPIGRAAKLVKGMK